MTEKSWATTCNTQVRTVLSRLGIQPGEGLATGLLFGQTLCLGVALFALYTASTALFLSHFDADVIAFVYVASAILLISIGIFFSRLERSLPFHTLLLGAMGGLLLLLLLLRVGLWIGSAPWVVFLLIVSLRVFWALANLVVWALAGRLFDVRQSKRLFPLIVVGSVLAIIAMGFMNERLIDLLGIPNLLLVAVGALFGTIVLMFSTLRIFQEKVAQGNPKSDVTEPQSWRQQFSSYRERYILWIFGFSFVSTLVTYILEFIFVSEAHTRYQGTKAYATFFGNYMGIATLILLVVSLFGGAILNRFGLKIGLLANSAMVTLLGTLLLFSQYLLGSMNSLFWLVVLTKLSDDVLVVAMNNTSTRILFQPIPVARRVSVQTAVESIIVPLSIGVAGLLLILVQLSGDISTGQTISVMVILCFCWLYAGFKVHSAYRQALRKAIRAHSIVSDRIGTTALMSDQDLQERLQSNQAAVLLYNINSVGETDTKRLLDRLPALLTDDVNEARLEIAQRIVQIGGPVPEQTDGLPAIDLIWQWASIENKVVRGEIWRSLRYGRYSAQADNLTHIYSQLENELAQASWLSSAWAAVQKVNGEPLLMDVLVRDLVQTRNNLFELLTFIRDRTLIMQIKHILEGRLSPADDKDSNEDTHHEYDDKEQRAYAQEILDDLLPSAFKAPLLAILTAGPSTWSIETVQENYPMPTLDYGQWLHALINASDLQVTALTRACALYAAEKLTAPHEQKAKPEAVDV